MLNKYVMCPRHEILDMYLTRWCSVSQWRDRVSFVAVAKAAGVVAAAAVAVTLLLAISQVPPSGKEVIRYCQWSGVRHQPVVWEIKKAFELENPDIEVKLEFYSRAYWQKLYTMIAAGVAPDVLYLGAQYVIDFARKGMLEDLTPLIERDDVDMSQYYKVVTDSCRWRERQYGMVMQFGAIALFYNRDLFDKAGVAYPNTKWEPVIEADTGKAARDPKTGKVRRRMVPYPWNWSDLLRAARRLTQDTDGDGTVDQFGFLTSSYMETCIASFIYQNCGAVMDSERTTVLLDSPEAVGAMQFVQDLRWKYKVAPTPETAGVQGLATVQLFETGKIAMTYDGSWRMDHYNRSGSLNYDVAALPRGPRGCRGMVATGLCNSLNAKSKHKEAAWKWMKFYAGVSGENDTREAKAQILLGEMKRGIPIMKRIARSGAFLNPKAEPQHEHVFLDQMTHAHDRWPCIGWNEWMGEKVGPEIRLLLDRGPQTGRTVKEGMGKATREANELIARLRTEQDKFDRARARDQRR